MATPGDSGSAERERLAARFRDGAGGSAFVCDEVLQGAPILCVCRTDYETLQFLCGKDHSRDEGGGRLMTIREAVALDESVTAVATMNEHHLAWRVNRTTPWVPDDDLSLWWF